MILGVNHVALSVPDMDRALHFYCDLLGFEKLSDAGWPAGTESADRILAVEGTSARVCHIATTNTPGSSPTEVGIPGVSTVYGRDPFGNVVELEEAQGRVIPRQPPMPEGYSADTGVGWPG